MSKDEPGKEKSKVEQLADEVTRLQNLVTAIAEVQAKHAERLKVLEKELW